MFGRLLKKRDPWYGPDSPSEGLLFPIAVTLATIIAGIGFILGWLIVIEEGDPEFQEQAHLRFTHPE